MNLVRENVELSKYEPEDFRTDSHGLNLQPTKKRRGKIMRDNFEKVTDIKKCSISAETCTLTNG